MHNKKSYIWNFLGRVVPQILFLITNIVLARYLTPDDFGSIGVLSIFVSLASTLTDSGFSGSLINERDIDTIDCSTVFDFNLIVSFSIYTLLCVFSHIIENFFGYDGLSLIVCTLCLVFVIRSFGIVPRAILTRDIQFEKQAIISFISVFIACISAIIGAIYGWRAYALVAYQLIYALIETLLLFYVTKYAISFKFSRSSFKKLFSFGAFTTITNIIDTIYENIMSLLFGKFMSISAVGYYSQAQKLETASTNSMVQTLNSVAFPILSRKKDNPQDFISESLSIQRSFITIIFPLIFIVIVYAHDIIKIIFGMEWIESAKYLKVLMGVGIFYILESLNRNYIKSFGKVKSLYYITLIKRVIGIALIFAFLVFSPFAMLYGYLLSTAVGYFFNKMIYCRLIKQNFLSSLIQDIDMLKVPILIFIGWLFIEHNIVNEVLSFTVIIITLVIYYVFVGKEYIQYLFKK